MPDVCLVVPCFNEASRLPSAAFLAYLDQHPDVSFCFVNDGSGDATALVLDAIAKTAGAHVSVLSLDANRGKAEAVREGMLRTARSGRFDAIGYWDADLATPLDELEPMREILARERDCQIVLGSRWLRLGSHIERSEMRHFLGRIFATAASRLLALPVYDSQCGAKLCRASAVEALFSEPFLTRWLFDVELLARLQMDPAAAKSGTAAIEMPLRAWRDVRDSRLTFGHMLRVPRDLWRIRRHYRVR